MKKVAKRIAALGFGLFLLGGCALPSALQITSWAIDGISYVATQKSATDHALSIIAQKDCAMMRILLGPDELCRDFADDATEIADGMSYDQLFEGNEFLSAESDPLAEFEPAGGGDESTIHNVKVAPLHVKEELQGKLAMLDDIEGIGPYGGGPYAREPGVVKAKTKELSLASIKPVAGYYTVIGSFKNHSNAKRLTETHRVLTPSVLSAKLNSTVLYRVVVGPFAKNDEKSVKINISQAGIADTWTIRVKPNDWHLAVLERPLTKTVEVATIQDSLNLRNSNTMGFAQIPSKLVY